MMKARAWYTFRSAEAFALRRLIFTIASAVVLTTCGGDGPSTPTPSLAAPGLGSPADDAVTARRPVLEVINVAASTSISGQRSYDFQVADSQAALTGTGTALISQTGVPEGANGRTAFEVDRDLQIATRYYWRSRAVQGSVQGQWSSVFRFRTDFAANTPPVILSVTPSSPRNDTNAEIEVRAVVQDQETDPGSLTYEWSAAAGGTFTGTGPIVRWRAPGVSGPTSITLTLTVIERYTLTDPDGRSETRENRATGSTLVRVNDSIREITGLATTFIDDFIHSERSAELCVRNFSDNCPGKSDELRDIRNDRAMFISNPSASGMGPGSIAFYADNSRRTSVPASASTFAVWTATCRFTSTNRSTGRTGTTTGTCVLTTVYENWQWFLCDSGLVDYTSTGGVLRLLPTTSGLRSVLPHHR